MRTTAGVTIAEVLIGAAIILLVGGAVIGVFVTSMGHYRQTPSSVKAAFLAEEGLEAVKTLRDRSWQEEIADLNTNTPYGLVFDAAAGRWEATTTPQVVDGRFHRWFTLAEVTRNNKDRIDSSGTVDPGTRQVTLTVKWPSYNGTSSREVSAYLTDLFGN